MKLHLARRLVRRFRPLAALAALGALALACSDDASSSEPGVPPSGVFSRTGPSGQPVRLAFVSGRGARLAIEINSAGIEITERTCFAYEGGGATVKATLKKKVVIGKSVSTEQDLLGRIVERAVSMRGDGSKLDADSFLEEGRYSYDRDGTTKAEDVLSGCP